MKNRSSYEVAELAWEKGQPAIHGGNSIFCGKPTWERSPSSHDTLESIVHQAKSLNQKLKMINPLCQEESAVEKVHKRLRTESTYCRGNETDHTSGMMGTSSWVSLDSPRSLMTKTSFEDSRGCSKDREEKQETEEGTIRCHATRRRRFADVHNESERRRRDRINQKLKALQKLVPNASKTDKASMLDEVIEYLKKLQAQVQLMSSRFIPHLMMNPLATQHLLQMSLLSGIGMGIIDPNFRASSTPPSLQPLGHTTPMASTPPSFLSGPTPVVPPVVPPCQPLRPTNSDAIMYHHPYATYFGQQPRECGFLPEDGKSQRTSGC